jgi:geranylgeranyl diphosphate synthase, type II
MPQLDFKSRLNQKAELVNNTLQKFLSDRSKIDPNLEKALRYVLEAEGKRIRAAMVMWCCELVSGRLNHNAEIAAAAIEMVHAYSLVHDDLPAMDNDDLRRGRPTCHKAFDEATAILTGDGLLTLAFEVLAKEIDNAVVAVKLIGRLAEAAGPVGMIAGQMADLKFENMDGDEELLEYIHTNKTAKIFHCAAAMGAITGKSNRAEFDLLCKYGLKIGLGFQIADDILDVSGMSKHLGKTAGKDVKAGKITYPSVVGMERSKHIAEQLADEAVATLEIFGRKADTLRLLAKVLLERTR